MASTALALVAGSLYAASRCGRTVSSSRLYANPMQRLARSSAGVFGLSIRAIIESRIFSWSVESRSYASHASPRTSVSRIALRHPQHPRHQRRR